jgi:Domain of unknown function (DUF1906)
MATEDDTTSPETQSSKFRAARAPVARRCTPGSWFDVSQPLTIAQATAFRVRGMQGVFRYGPLPNNSDAPDLSSAELWMLLFDVGLEVGMVQHPRKTNVLASHSGAADGLAIAQHALTVGYPLTAHIFLDLEGVIGTSPGQVTTYCVDWSRAVIQMGYAAGLYVGFSAILGPQDLYELPGFDCYWSDLARRRVNVRGCAIQQFAEVPAMGGLPNYDPDLIAPDALGGLPIIAAAS